MKGLLKKRPAPKYIVSLFLITVGLILGSVVTMNVTTSQAQIMLCSQGVNCPEDNVEKPVNINPEGSTKLEPQIEPTSSSPQVTTAPTSAPQQTDNQQSGGGTNLNPCQ